MALVFEASFAFSYTIDFSALEWIWTDETIAAATAPLSETSAYTNPVLQAVRLAIYQELNSGGEPCASMFGSSEHSVTIIAHETIDTPAPSALVSIS